MIVEGNPQLGLQKHQQDAYRAVQKAYENGNKATVVIPTGCGKSFIALQLMADNKDKRILFMAPTNAIKNQMYNYIAKYIVGVEPTNEKTARMISDEYFPHLKIMLYPSLLRVNDEQMEKLNADIIVMDELHRTGADKWGEKINTLLQKNPNANILGLTATPDRMDDKNVVDELFEGNINYELTLVDALRKGIVKSPQYVKCDYALSEHLEGIRLAIANCSDEQKKKELQVKYDRMRKIVEQADGIPELFAKNIQKKDGKYIIFCKDKEHMDELIGKAKEWFSSIDTEPEIYSVYSGDGYTDKDNSKTIEEFESSKSEHLKLLFSIEMLNEGLHVEDISGVIMARPTDSRIIYLQQLGRALSSDTSRDKTIVFDLVNNYLKNNLDAEINRRTNGSKTINGDEAGISSGEDTEIEDLDIFRIQGETKEFLELLNEVQDITGHTPALISARKIKEWMERNTTTKPPATNSSNYEEKMLALALRNIRVTLINPYSKLQSSEEKDEFQAKHPELQEILQIVTWIDENNLSQNLINARKIKKWMDDRQTNKPPRLRCDDEEEQKLGTALQGIRLRLLNPYMQLESEEEKIQFEDEHPELKEILQIITEIDKNILPANLVNARKIKEWMEKNATTKTPSASSKNEEEKKLGIALAAIRRNLIKPYMNIQSEDEKRKFEIEHPELFEILETINEIDDKNVSPHLINIRKIKKWMDDRNTTKPPTNYSQKDEEERKLGRALDAIRLKLIKPYRELQTEEERLKFESEHPELQEVLSVVNWIDAEKGLYELRNTLNEIKEWVDIHSKFPTRSQGASDTEQVLARKLAKIRTSIIKPYMVLQTEEERTSYREQHPELDEVMSTISELDIQCGNKKQQELAILIRQDLEKRKSLQEARKLEQEYEQQLSARETKDMQEQGVDFNE